MAMGGGSAGAISMDFASVPTASICFVGNNDTFSFVEDSSGNDFQITLASDPSLITSFGTITGNFGVTNVQTVSPTYETATVTGSGTFTVTDNTGVLSGTITWADMYTLGTTGGLNTFGVANLSAINYTGTKTSMAAFLAGGTMTATFQFSPPKSISQLIQDGQTSCTSYSGTMNSVPIPGAVLLLGAGMARLAAYARRRRD